MKNINIDIYAHKQSPPRRPLPPDPKEQEAEATGQSPGVGILKLWVCVGDPTRTTYHSLIEWLTSWDARTQHNDPVNAKFVYRLRAGFAWS